MGAVKIFEHNDGSIPTAIGPYAYVTHRHKYNTDKKTTVSTLPS